MPTDPDFLAAVTATPADRLPRLVYADWLDERGDVRGELIRLEEETRERVAWDDTLWKLKPRRNELRGQVDADWLKAMGYGQTCEPLFRGQPFPTDVRAAWRLIREAHERWTGEPMPDVGGHADKVAEAEKRLGLTLPPSVREFAAWLFDLTHTSTWRWRLALTDYWTLRPVHRQDALSIIRSDDGGDILAIRHADIHHTDPPVYRYFQLDPEDESDAPGPVFVEAERPASPALTQFMFDSTYRSDGARGGLMVEPIQHPSMIRTQLEGAFPFCTLRGDAELYEGVDLSATLTTPRNAMPGHLTVRACRGFREGLIPDWMVAVCRADGHREGIFWGVQARALNEYRERLGLAPIDEIPF